MKQLLPGQMPFSQEAEEAVLGAILINPDAYLLIASKLKPDDFYILRHKFIWQAMGHIYQRNEQIDFITIREELQAIGRLNDVGGPGYLLQLANNTPSSTRVETYAGLVERASTRRKLLSVADEIQTAALDETKPIEDVCLESMRALDAVQPDSNEHFVPGAVSIQRYDDVQQDLIKRASSGELLGVPTNPEWERLADVLPMAFFGDLIVVSGFPGSGKSAFVEMWAEHCAKLGLRTEYIHTEMSSNQVLGRRMARHSGVPYHLLASGQAVKQYPAMVEADHRISKWVNNIAYHWMPDVKFNRLAQHMRLSAERGVRAFFLDHFQDIAPPTGIDVVRAIEQMCVWFAAFAEKRQVLLAIASQQNAAGKTKWTNKLIEKAVLWLSLKRHVLKSEYVYTYDGVETRTGVGKYSPEVDVLLNKARFGALGKTKMLNNGPRFMFLDMSRVQRPALTAKVVSIEELQEAQRASEKAQ